MKIYHIYFYLLIVFLFQNCRKAVEKDLEALKEVKEQSFPKKNSLDSLLTSYDRELCLVMNYDSKESPFYEYNPERSQKRFPVASTFKIPNTLIALNEGIITPSDTLRWDGKKRDLEAWNQDQTLSSAFQHSTVWAYQELARKLSLPIYQKYLQEMHYGNEQTGDSLDSFWLNGTLRISTEEQVAFLKNLYYKNYNFSEKTYTEALSIMTEFQNDSLRLIAKTGLHPNKSPRPNDNVVWYVGYVDKKENPSLYFAFNMPYTNPDDLRLRKEIVYQCLRELGYYPSQK